MPCRIWDGDAAAWQWEARALLEHHRLWLPVEQIVTKGELNQYFAFNPSDSHWYSKYGIVNTMMSLPPTAVEMLVAGPGLPPPRTRAAILNLWNIVLSLLLASVLYVITGRYTQVPWRRCAYVLACFFCSYLWFYQRLQGSELYQALFFALAFECLLRSLRRPRSPSRRWLLAAWLFVGLLVLTRLIFGILLPVVFLLCWLDMMVHRRSLRRLWPALVIPPLIVLAAAACVNNLKFGSPWSTGYEQWHAQEYSLNGTWLDGVWGLLFSGHWSIFIYFPPLLVALPNGREFSKLHRLDSVIIAAVFLTTLLVLARIPGWRGEWSYGPRYMIFILPVAALPALLTGNGATGPWRAALLLTVAGALLFSGWLQFEVIQADFWFWYRIQQPLQGVMDREIAEYFFDHHEGIILHDLWSHQPDLNQTALFSHLRGRPGVPAGYHNLVRSLLDQPNLFWDCPPDPRNDNTPNTP